MSGVMSYSETSEVLGIPITLKMIMHDKTDFTILAVKDDGEYHNLFTYKADIDALQADKEEVNKLADDHARQVNNILKGVIIVSDGIVWLITTVLSTLSHMFGGFVGFGLIGILVVLAIIISVAALWIYAFFIIGPLMAISFGLKSWLNKKKEVAIKQLSRNALDFARRCRVDLDLYGEPKQSSDS
jgi:hypothetical protein